MILISHRGNLNGKKVDEENSPKYIEKALKEGFDVEYVQTKFGRRFIAAKIGTDPSIRLIDNVELMT